MKDLNSKGLSQALKERVLHSRASLLALGLLLIMAVMSFVSPHFMTASNMRSILLGTTMIGIIAIGMTAPLITGGFDLSVGSTLALAGVVVGVSFNLGFSLPVAIIIALLSAVGVGLVNGFFIAILDFNPFVTTLGMMIGVRGVLLVVAGGRGITRLPDTFTQIGQGRLFGIPYPVYFLIIGAIVFDYLFRNMRWFRLSYYVGDNEEAATMSGINTVKVKLFNYVFVAILAGISGLFMAARTGMASVTIGEQAPLSAIAACVIGGSSLSGGAGTVIGAVLGAFLLQLLTNALNLAGVGIYWQQVFTGAVLLAAIGLDKLGTE
ncbi:ABC transporter permease [Candidatus Bipolaricaulota bacterium]|nr:ABC transporter permease [Candidatus Bipolaricaulota bacterium]